MKSILLSVGLGFLFGSISGCASGPIKPETKATVVKSPKAPSTVHKTPAPQAVKAKVQAPKPVVAPKKVTAPKPVVAPVAKPKPASEVAPLSPEVRKKFHKIRFDPKPEKLALDTHFLISNEIHHELYRKPILNIGGIYVGVGTDQNYVLAGWAKPSFIVMLDFDQWVVDLHRVYFLIFKEARTSAEFIKMWDPKNRKSLHTKIIAAYGKKRSWNIRLVLKKSHRNVYQRLVKLKERYHQLDVPMFLTDAGQYTFLRDMILAGRTIAVRGNLLGNRTIRDIGRFAKAHNEVIGAFYISNAEEYAKYFFPFKRNFRALPVDDKSVLLRTLPFGSITGRYWTYYTQTLKNFRLWLRHTRLLWVRTLVGWQRRKRDGFYALNILPSKLKKRLKKMRKRPQVTPEKKGR